MLPEDFRLLAYASREDSRSNSNGKAVLDKEWIYMPPEGGLKIERHGHSAVVHLWPSTEVKTKGPAFSSVQRGLATHDAYKQSGTGKLSMNAVLPSPTSPVELPDLEESQQVVKIANQMPSAVLSAHYIPFNPLDEPSPLGLTLRKTPSLLDLIQMKLAHNDAAMLGNYNVQATENSSRGRRSSTSSTTHQDKLKASNFPASTLKVGTWERVSRYEGDLVAKCYYAKRKLVWEVLENGLKSKIEIQWSDIIALKASYLETEPGILEIQVSRPPLFFKETNPQPRKHTLWQATSDFTRGQATICKLHYLKFPPGLLNRHYEKLMQCDPRLKSLSEKALFSIDSDSSEPHREKAVQHDKKMLLQQDPKYHSLQLDNERLHSYPSLHAILGSDSLQPAGIIPKHEPIELDDRMREFTTGSSSTSSGIASQGHDDGSHTSRKECFQFSDHTADDVKPKYQFHSTARDQCLDQFSKVINVQASYFCPSFPTSDNKRQMLDEGSCRFLEEPPSQVFNEQPDGPRLNLLSPYRVGSKGKIHFPFPPVLTGSSFLEAEAGSPPSFQGCTKYEQRQPNEGLGSIALRGKRLLPEEMIKSSFEPSMCRIKPKLSSDLLLSVPQIPSLPQFYDPVLHGLSPGPSSIFIKGDS